MKFITPCFVRVEDVEERMRAKAIEALDQTIRAVLFIDEKDLA